jgi:dGTPase
MVRDLLKNSWEENNWLYLAFSREVEQAMMDLRDFLYDRVYDVTEVHADFVRSAKVVRELFEEFMSNDELYKKEIGPVPENHSHRLRSVCDFVAGMTDRYSLELYNGIFLPRPWGVM